MRWRSEWHSPAPATRTSTSPEPGSGTGTSTSSAGRSQSVSWMAFTRRTVAHELKSHQELCYATRMAAPAPLWLNVVLRAERAVGRRVEAAVHSDTYFDLVTELNRGTRRLTGAAESVSKRGLHLLNLPAGTDVRRLREQLARMDRRLLQISKELEQLERTRDAEHV